MPQTHLRKRLQEELDGENPPGRHMGYRLQAIGRALAKEYGVRNYQMRNRMIQLGYTAAKGVLNFVDDGYIEPFAFSADTCRGSRTFVISPKETLEEYVRNQAFRELLDTGHYVYADGHICVNDPAYVVLHNGKLRLTEWPTRMWTPAACGLCGATTATTGRVTSMASSTATRSITDAAWRCRWSMDMKTS